MSIFTVVRLSTFYIFNICNISGVGWFLRKVGSSVTPTVTLSKVGEEYSFLTESTFKTSDLRFKIGQEKNQKTLDDQDVPTTFTLEGNTLTQTEKRPGGKKSVVIRTFGDKELTVKCIFGDVVSNRWYKAL